jgi:hypothetical protein
MSKKYTCAGMSCGGRVKGYADGGSVGQLIYRGKPGEMRSEATEHERASRTLKKNPPTTVLQDVVGRFHEPQGQVNALRDAIRGDAEDRMRSTGYKRGGKVR